MVDTRDRGSDRVVLVVLGAIVVGLVLAMTQLEVSPHQFTPGTAIVSVLLLLGALAVPALLFSRWQAAESPLEQRR